MLSDVTLQFHISYSCQDNDGGRHCQGMISDNSRHLGELEEIYGKVLVVWGRRERVKSAPFLCIVTFRVTVNFTPLLLGIGDIYTSWQIACCKSIYWSSPPFILDQLANTDPSHRQRNIYPQQIYVTHIYVAYLSSSPRYVIMVSCWEYWWSPFNVLIEEVLSRP